MRQGHRRLLGVARLSWRRRTSVFALAGATALVFAAVALAGYFTTVSGDGPEGYWRLGEASGTVAADATGHGHAGTYVGGPTLGVTGALVGDSDTAVSFTSASQSVTVPYSAALNPSGPFSVEALIKIDSFPDCSSGSNPEPIVFSSDQSNSAGYSLSFDCVGGGGSGFVFERETTSGTNHLDGGARPIASNTWYQVVGVWDGTAMRLYWNGVDISFAQTGSADPTVPNTTQNLEIGHCTCSGVGKGFPGSIDEVAIYGYALTAAQVAAHYAALQGPSIDLAPASASIDAGVPQSLTATLRGVSPLSGRAVTFTVAGTNARTLTALTDTSGVATAAYTPDIVGVDNITASTLVGSSTFTSAASTVSVSGISCNGTPSQGMQFPGFTTSYYYDGAPQGPNSLRDTIKDALARGRRLGLKIVNDPHCPTAVSVVLFLGEQLQKGGVWGTNTLDVKNNFRTMPFIRETAKAFAIGFYQATTSLPQAFLRLVISTNNDNDALASGSMSCANGSHLPAYCAGRVWAQMIDRANNDLASFGSASLPVSDQVRISGGNDIEPFFCESQACAQGARAWANGYHDTTQRLFVNTGSCDGCPQTAPGGPSTKVGSKLHWTVGDIYFVSWGVGRARPLPQIYNNLGANAAEWEQMARAARNQGTAVPLFVGSLTEQQGCAQSSALDTCHGATDQGPSAGWTQLYNRLNAVNAPSWLMQPLFFATDVAHHD